MKIKLLLFFIIIQLLLGLRSIDYKGYFDPDFLDYRMESTIVCFGSATIVLEESFLKSFSKQKAIKSFQWKRCDEIFPPTRDWNLETRVEQAKKYGYQTILGIGMEFEAFGGNATTYHGGSSMSSAFSSQSEYEITIFDIETKRKAYVAKVGVQNKGTYYAGNVKSEAKALAKRLVKEFKKTKIL